MNENNNNAPYRAGAKKGPRFCFTGCLAFYKCRKRIRDTEMARHRRRAIFIFEESVFRFRYAFAELISANVAKPCDSSGAEQTRRCREPPKANGRRGCGGQGAPPRAVQIVDAAAASDLDGDPEPVG